MKEKLTPEQKEYNQKLRSFASKVRKSIKKEGLRSGTLLLEYWQSNLPKEFNLEKIGIEHDEIVRIIKEQISNYKSSLPA